MSPTSLTSLESPLLEERRRALDSRLIEAARDGELELLERMLRQGASPLAGRSAALRRAAEFGHERCALLLTPLSDPTEHDSEALRLAARAGLTELVKALIPVSDAKAASNGALLMALRGRHFDCVTALLPASDPSMCESLALRSAAAESDSACLKELLPFCDASERDFEALRLACLCFDPDAPARSALLLDHRPPPMERLRELERLARRCQAPSADVLLSRVEARELALASSPSPSARSPRL